MSSLYANWMLGLSNLVGLLVLPYLSDWKSCFVLVGTISASTLFHLAESHKHHLPGVSYWNLNKFSYPLLWVDRVCALIAFFHFVKPNMLHNQRLCFVGFCGLTMMGFSEMVFTTKNMIPFFVLTHCLWHFTAYYIVYLTQTMVF